MITDWRNAYFSTRQHIFVDVEFEDFKKTLCNNNKLVMHSEEYTKTHPHPHCSVCEFLLKKRKEAEWRSRQ